MKSFFKVVIGQLFLMDNTYGTALFSFSTVKCFEFATALNFGLSLSSFPDQWRLRHIDIL